MSEEHSDNLAGRMITVRLSPERAVELARLARDLKKDEVELVSEILETEIEAQYGIRYGPFRRKHLYRYG